MIGDSMKQGLFTIVENTRLTESVWQMRLVGDTSAITASGQFVNIQLDGLFLRRPISVCDCADGTLTLLYKVVGKGTAQMAAMTAGQTLDVLTGLGNGYDLSKAGDKPLLIGGGAAFITSLLTIKLLTEFIKKHTFILFGIYRIVLGVAVLMLCNR